MCGSTSDKKPSRHTGTSAGTAQSLIHRLLNLHRRKLRFPRPAEESTGTLAGDFLRFRLARRLRAKGLRAKVYRMSDSGNNMKQHFRSKTHRRPAHIRQGQKLVRWFFRILFLVFYRIRIHGLENYPSSDRLLICSNHQSNLDPLVVGAVCPRPINYLGKETLFRPAPFGWFLRWNDVIPIDRSGSGIGGMKETLRRLKNDEAVLIFPEGSRSLDGEMQPLKQGFCSLTRRASALLVPIGVEGTYDALPPSRKAPRWGRIHVVVGPQIEPEDYESLDNDQLTQLLEQRIEDCFKLAREKYLA